MRNNYGYSGFSDVRVLRHAGMQVRGLGSIGQILAPFLYAPDLGPVGSGAAYFPGDVSQDASALNYLGFIDDATFAGLIGTTGTEGGDMAQEDGAWDPGFRAGVARFQASKGLTTDTWIGPNTRTALAVAVAAKNLSGVPSLPVPPLPPAVIPVNPGTVPVKPGGSPLPGVTPAPVNDTMTYVVVGVGVVALVGLAAGLLKKKPKAA